SYQEFVLSFFAGFDVRHLSCGNLRIAGMEEVEIGFDAFKQPVAHHVVGEFDRGGKASGICPAVTFHNDAVETQEHAAIGAAHVHLFAKRIECTLGQHVAEPGHKRAAHGGPQIAGDLTGGALRSLERDVARESFGNDDIDRALADIVAFDEAVISHRGHVSLTQHAACVLDLLLALDLLDPYIEKANRWLIDTEYGTRHGGAENGEIDQLLRIRADGGSYIEHNAFGAQRRPDRGDGRAINRGHGIQAELRHGHQRASVAGRDAGIGGTALDRFDRLPHGRLPSAAPQGLARLVIHPDRDFAGYELAPVSELRKPAEFRANGFLYPVDYEAHIRAAGGDRHKRRNDHIRPVVAAHGTDGNSDHALFF